MIVFVLLAGIAAAAVAEGLVLSGATVEGRPNRVGYRARHTGLDFQVGIGVLVGIITLTQVDTGNALGAFALALAAGAGVVWVGGALVRAAVRAGSHQ